MADIAARHRKHLGRRRSLFSKDLRHAWHVLPQTWQDADCLDSHIHWQSCCFQCVYPAPRLMEPKHSCMGAALSYAIGGSYPQSARPERFRMLFVFCGFPFPCVVHYHRRRTQRHRHTIYIFIYAYIYICTYVYIYISIDICVYIDVCVRAHIYIYIYMCTFRAAHLRIRSSDVRD